MTDLLVALLLNCAAFTLASWMYVRVLLFVIDRLHGWRRYATGLCCYILMSLVVILSFMYVFQSAVHWWITLIGWAVSITPGVYWFWQHKIRL